MTETRAIIVPKWGLSMEQGTITKWLVAEGESFNEGDEIVEIETDKISNVVEAPFSGRLERIVAQPGETLPVGSLIGVSAAAGVSPDRINEFVASHLVVGGVIEASAPAPQTGLPGQDAGSSRVVVGRPQASHLESLSGLRSDESDSDVLATLHARKFASENQINLLKVSGSGRRGRISKADVEAAIQAAGGIVPVPETNGRRDVSPTRGGSADAFPHAPSIAASENARRVEPLSAMRRTIARRLQASKQSAPHYRVTMDCAIDELLQTRKTLNASDPDLKLSVNDFVIKACAMALIAEPDCNVQFDGEHVHYFSHADITVAVALPTGLITPKIARADTKGLAEISDEMKTLAERAKSGGLTPDEYKGGTFSISNLGMFGVRQFDAIINPPQCAILAVGQGAPRYAPGPTGPELVTEMTLCLSSDHRIIDGALAARLLGRIKQNLEHPLFMLA